MNLTIFFFVLLNIQSHFLLKEDIAEDRKALHDHGALFTDTDINRLKAFDKYANMKLNSLILPERNRVNTLSANGKMAILII
jgi:hypothetical protein